MKSLDFLTDAANRELRGDPSGASWVYFHVMTAEDRLRFDGFLVQTGDDLAWQAGTPESRFMERVRRMVETQRAYLASRSAS